MFDIRAKSDIIVTGLTFMLRYGYNNITIYTASGSFSTKSSSQGSWTEIFNESYDEDCEITLDHSIMFEQLPCCPHALNCPIVLLATPFVLLAWTKVKVSFADVAVGAGSTRA
jgi:hypothetical protein